MRNFHKLLHNYDLVVSINQAGVPVAVSLFSHMTNKLGSRGDIFFYGGTISALLDNLKCHATQWLKTRQSCKYIYLVLHFPSAIDVAEVDKALQVRIGNCKEPIDSSDAYVIEYLK